MNYTVYIIQNPRNRIYIGLSEDPYKRLVGAKMKVA